MTAVRLRTRKAPRQERSRRTVERILDAAARIFDDTGYRATTTNHVADAAGVSVGSLYQYFPNKDAILVALAERHVAEVSAALDGYIAGAATRQPDLHTVVAELVALVVDLHDLDGLHLLLAHQVPRTPELQEQLDRLLEHVVDAIGGLLERHVPEPSEPRLTAALVVAMVDAAVHDVILRQPRGPTRDAAAARTVEMVRSMLSPAAGVS